MTDNVITRINISNYIMDGRILRPKSFRIPYSHQLNSALSLRKELDAAGVKWRGGKWRGRKMNLTTEIVDHKFKVINGELIILESTKAVEYNVRTSEQIMSTLPERKEVVCDPQKLMQRVWDVVLKAASSDVCLGMKQDDLTIENVKHVRWKFEEGTYSYSSPWYEHILVGSERYDKNMPRYCAKFNKGSNDKRTVVDLGTLLLLDLLSGKEYRVSISKDVERSKESLIMWFKKNHLSCNKDECTKRDLMKVKENNIKLAVSLMPHNFTFDGKTFAPHPDLYHLRSNRDLLDSADSFRIELSRYRIRHFCDGLETKIL